MPKNNKTAAKQTHTTFRDSKLMCTDISMLSAHFFSLSAIHWTLCVLNSLFHHSNSFLLLVFECDFCQWMGNSVAQLSSDLLRKACNCSIQINSLFSHLNQLIRFCSVQFHRLKFLWLLNVCHRWFFSSSSILFSLSIQDLTSWYCIHICISLRAHLMYQFIRFISTDDSLVYASLATN